MGKCIICGESAGIGRDAHIECKNPPAPPRPLTEQERFILSLRPALISAGRSAGIAAAFAFTAILAALSVVWWVWTNMLSPVR